MGQNVDLRVLRAEEFAPFRQRNIARYAQELLFARATDTEEHALTEAQGALDEMLPQGADTPRNYLLAAESGGETVGELWCDTTEPETVFINDFFVYPACRGHGWGKAMLRAVEELAAAQSFEQVVTHVYHTNRIALEMFEAAGFTQVGPPKGGNIFLRKRYMRSPFLVCALTLPAGLRSSGRVREVRIFRTPPRFLRITGRAAGCENLQRS